MNYLPNIYHRDLYELILTRNWSLLVSQLEKLDYDRIGLDRLLTVVQDMENNFGPNHKSHILDVGCNNGFFSVGLAGFGYKVTGIDSYVIDKQNRYESLKLEEDTTIPDLHFVNEDILPYLKQNENEAWDFVLLFSVAHQWEYGYAHSGENKFTPEENRYIINEICSKVKKAVYYECPFDEPGFEVGYGFKYLERYLNHFDKYQITFVEETVGSSGFPRQLYRIERRT